MTRNILVIEGATRPERSSIKGSNWIQDTIKINYPEFKVALVSPSDFNLPYDGASDNNYAQILSQSDALIIVVPEYNHGYPGRLKTLLDSEYKLYKDKPVMLCGWSNGGFGGVRAVENLIPVVRELGLLVTLTNFNFSRHKEVFDDNGKLLQPEYTSRFLDAFNEMIRLLNKLS